jgi:HisJ family histidinol phosphate phosphatase
VEQPEAPLIRHDDHVHGGRRFSGHSPEYPLEALARAAAARGIVASLREHAPLPAEFVAEHPDALKETPGVGIPVGLLLGPRDNVDSFLDAVAGSGLPLGFEIDVLDPVWLDASLRVMDLLGRRAREHGLEIDCFNLSHHYPWDMSFGGLQAALARVGGPEAFLRSYFGSIRTCLATGMFGAVSHLEALRKFDRAAAGGPPFAAHMQLYREETTATLKTMQLHGTALEYNTAGYGTWGRAYLSPETLAEALSIGLAISVGSDAHDPGRVGANFRETWAELKAAGATQVCTFKRRRAAMVPL